MNKQPKFIEKAKETQRFHRGRLIENEKWTISDTAKALGRSIGSICEDMLISKWLKTHETQIEKFDYAYEALKFIRKTQKIRNLDEV